MTQQMMQTFSTRELVAELTTRVKSRYGTDMVPPQHWDNLYKQVEDLRFLQQSQPLEFPEIVG